MFLISCQGTHLRKFHTQIHTLSFSQKLCNLTLISCPIIEISGNEEAAARPPSCLPMAPLDLSLRYAYLHGPLFEKSDENVIWDCISLCLPLSLCTSLFFSISLCHLHTWITVDLTSSSPGSLQLSWQLPSGSVKSAMITPLNVTLI